VLELAVARTLVGAETATVAAGVVAWTQPVAVEPTELKATTSND
jgi:hypothetical protein